MGTAGKWLCLGLVPCKVESVDLFTPLPQMFPAPSSPPADSGRSSSEHERQLPEVSGFNSNRKASDSLERLSGVVPVAARPEQNGLLPALQAELSFSPSTSARLERKEAAHWDGFTWEHSLGKALSKMPRD